MHINKLSLGTAQFGIDYGIANDSGMVKNDELEKIIQLIKHNNINTFDTAIAYGCAEKRLGEYALDDVYMISKLPEMPLSCSNIDAWVMESVKHSLLRLNVPSLYALLLHRPLQLLEPQGMLLYNALMTQQRNGLVKKIGISIYSPDELQIMDKLNLSFDIVQVPFNILDQRLITSGWLDRLYQQGIEIHARSVFLQGLLLMSESARPEKFSRWNTMWNEWDDWLAVNKLAPLQACLEYVLSFKEISKVIVGVDSAMQLMEILQVASKPVSFMKVPEGIKIEDPNLLNPSNWSLL